MSTIVLLLKGYSLGLLLAIVLTAFASATRIGADLLETLTSMFHPLPSIALLPIALHLVWTWRDGSDLRFGARRPLVGCAEHVSGFRAVSPTLRMVGRNYGLSTAGYITRILIPGAFPSILTGLEDRLGVRLAHTDRGGACFRSEFGHRADSGGTSSSGRMSF